MFWAFLVAIAGFVALRGIRNRLAQLEDTVAEQRHTVEALERLFRVVTGGKKETRPPAHAPPVTAPPPPVAAITPPAPTVTPPPVPIAAVPPPPPSAPR